MAQPDRARVIFGNQIADKDYEKACNTKKSSMRRFGDDSQAVYHLKASEAPVVGSRLGVRMLSLANPPKQGILSQARALAASTSPAASPAPIAALDLYADAQAAPLAPRTARTVDGAQGKPLVVGNIRMGFGHYRISMAMASAAHAMGFVPYWFDLCSFEGSTASKLVESQNKLYSMGSRLSQRFGAFNSLYWEPLNSEGFRKLAYNASDQKNAELFVPVYRDLPRDVAFVATHAWPAQGAIHAGLTSVVNAIPDNWPMALHLSEGSLHTVQTPGAYLGYKMLRGFDENRQLQPMPPEAIACVGHYIDHEIVEGIEADCQARRARAAEHAPVRYLVCVGGAGAQQDLICSIIEHLLPLVEARQACLLINVGDHENVWQALVKAVPALAGAVTHFNSFDQVEALCQRARAETLEGIHAFCDSEIFSAVYSTNVLMRIADVMVTKPSELAFYPVPKLMIKRVGGHEAWGAIRAAEVGDGTYELETADEICAMIDCVARDASVVADMCDAICRNKLAGLYDGAYKAVALAAKLDCAAQV